MVFELLLRWCKFSCDAELAAHLHVRISFWISSGQTYTYTFQSEQIKNVSFPAMSSPNLSGTN